MSLPTQEKKLGGAKCDENETFTCCRFRVKLHTWHELLTRTVQFPVLFQFPLAGGEKIQVECGLGGKKKISKQFLPHVYLLCRAFSPVCEVGVSGAGGATSCVPLGLLEADGIPLAAGFLPCLKRSSRSLLSLSASSAALFAP